MKRMRGEELNSETWEQQLVVHGWRREGFRVLIITLLSLFLPLSYVLLSRISTLRYIFADSLPYASNINLLFLYCDSTIIHSLLSLVTVATFAHGLTGPPPILISSPEPAVLLRLPNSRLYASWIFLCTLQVCVGLGIEGSIAAGVEYGSGFINNRESTRNSSSILIIRVLFFLGLHETMLFWSRGVVKPVVDDTVLGFAEEEGWVERVAMAASFGALWWWRLRDEVDSLVQVVSSQLERRPLLVGGVGRAADFVAWCLYYVTVSIGTIRIFNALIWLGNKLLSRKYYFVRGNIVSDSRETGDKL